MVHSVKACAGYVAVLLLHVELLRVDFQLMSFPKSVCVCSAGSLSLGMALSSWCYRAFFCPGEGGMLFHLGGMFGAGKGCQLQSYTNLSLCKM